MSSWDELFGGGGGGVRKRVLRAGSGPVPEYKHAVSLRCTGWFLQAADAVDNEAAAAADDAGSSGGSSGSSGSSGGSSSSGGGGGSSSNRSDAPFEGPTTLGTFVGASDLVPGLELALRNMQAGELARVQVAPKFGFGDEGRPGGAVGGLGAVPPGAALEYEVECLSVGAARRAAEEHADAEDRAAGAGERKAMGNALFGWGEWGKAARCYSEALAIVGSEPVVEAAAAAADAADAGTAGTAGTAGGEGGGEGEGGAVVNAANLALVVGCANNLGIAHLKAGDARAARSAHRVALAADGANVKALFLLGKLAATEFGEHAEAAGLLVRALAAAEAAGAAKDAAAVRAEQKRLAGRVRAHEARERKMFGGTLRARTPAAPTSGTTDIAAATAAAAASGGDAGTEKQLVAAVETIYIKTFAAGLLVATFLWLARHFL